MARGIEEEVAWRCFCRDVVPFTAMIAVECITVGSNTLFKAATMRGLSFYVFVFYSYVVATLALLPLTLLFRRYLISKHYSLLPLYVRSRSHRADFNTLFQGGLVSSLGSVIHTWVLHLKGPVYISLFKPLSIVVAVGMGAIFLGDALYLGSVVGSVILSLGFYAVIWGKSRENSTRTVAGSEQSPLLLTHTIGDEASSIMI
ncbi:unnamed protein product [Eruca vesicaria subsp. sativa]|uniref:WAT1-related protein n=1 Tax=Eruca vesicaria subsp. sativa TaxID=29727 RepID=A0ABC8LAT4_ERUVS|nr:unnamed protein product [Eruca vesicaria subsp. sativa]